MARHTGKYRALWAWLTARTDDEVQLSFGSIEDILGFPLPPSSRHHLAHWYSYGGSAVGRAIQDAGWRAADVNLTAETVHFRRERLRSNEVEMVDELARRGVDDRIAGLLLAYAARHAVEISTADRKHEVALAATRDAYTAVFATSTNMSIALDPQEAKAACERLGLRLRENTPATSYVVVGAADLDEPHVEIEVHALLAAAFERSDRGPRWTRGLPERTIARGQTCPKCFIEMPLNGVCQNCA